MKNMIVYSSCSKSETTWNKEIKKVEKKCLTNKTRADIIDELLKTKKENIDNWTVK